MYSALRYLTETQSLVVVLGSDSDRAFERVNQRHRLDGLDYEKFEAKASPFRAGSMSTSVKDNRNLGSARHIV